jgi:type I restriction enzyme M protein
VLTPGRYVGAEEVVDDEGSFDQHFKNLKSRIQIQFNQSYKLQETIAQIFKGIN